MAIDVRCTGCGKSYTVDPQFVGRRVRCKHCGDIFQIALPPGGEAAPQETDPFASVAALEDAAGSMPVDVDAAPSRPSKSHSYAQAPRQKKKPTIVGEYSGFSRFVDNW